MAVLWQKIANNRCYEVRSAGATRRLYTDGVFHSQYNPRRPVTGSVWDLLMLPAFFHPPGKIKRILMLGVGGGTVIQQLTHFLNPEQIIGVELSKIHLYVAKRFFKIDQQVTSLVHADALDWLAAYRGEGFDLIIDDLFGGSEGNAERAVNADRMWFQHLLRPLKKSGTLVINFGEQKEFRRCGCFSHPALGKKFTNVFTLTKPGYENVVGVFTRAPASAAQLRANLQQIPALNPAKKTSQLRYCIRSIRRYTFHG